MKRLEIVGLEGLGEVRQGDSIAALIVEACAKQGMTLADQDVLVVAHKIVSKAEGQVLKLEEVQPSPRAVELAKELGKDARALEVILRESRRIIRTGGGTIIVETHHGFICANAGVDLSNVGLGKVALLPRDPDGSARKIREEVQQRLGVAPGVIVSDSFGRAWRLGTVDIAIGVAGLRPFKDDRGSNDPYGYELRAAVAAVADELAGPAEIVMGKKGQTPVVIIRGYERKGEDGSAQELLRPEAEDLFRSF